jgi:tetratricopeptide (TPR) repeat protein
VADAIDFKSKRILIIDDDPGMRNTLRLIVNTFGVTRIYQAASSNEAVRRIQLEPYDIILCDYFLGEGRDGQQFLEELRHNKLIKLSTVFMMITAERSYEKVVSAVELAPDDYLIKPFSGEQLRTRLERIMVKKEAFAPAYALIEAGELRAAIQACEQLMETHPRYLIDIIRLKADLCLTLGDYAEAERVYRQVLETRALPWARMGFGKALFMQDKFEEAEEIFQEVVEGSPQYLEAYDWLADAHEAVGKGEEAQTALAAGVARSPNTLPRQRKLGSIARRNGDLDTAEKAFSTVVENGKYSYFRSPEDYADLGGIMADKGKFSEALNLMGEARKQFSNSPEASMCAAVMESRIYRQSGNEEAAQAALAEALQLQSSQNPNISNTMKLSFAQACYENGNETMGNSIVSDLIKNNHEDKALMQQAERTFEAIGRKDFGKNLIKDSAGEIIHLNNLAVRKAQQGDLEGAIAMLKDAATKLPNNMQIVLNVAHALLVYTDKNGWDPDYMADAKRYLEKARSRDPGHAKLGKLNAMYQEVCKKFGTAI